MRTKTLNIELVFIALLALAATASQTRAQSTYTPYAFTNFAGMPGGAGSADGTGTEAEFLYPTHVAVDSAHNVYVADGGNSTIRMITPSEAVTTLAGSAGQVGSTDGTGSEARFYQPVGVAVDNAGNVYVADTANHTIRKITPAGVVTTLAGSAGQSGSADGTGSEARFNQPGGLSVDSASNLYVADLANSTIRKITPGGEVTTLAGSAGQIGTSDGTGSAARFSSHLDVAVDSAGDVYVSDSYNYTIRKVTPIGEVTTVAGSAGQSGSADGTGSAARFYNLDGLAVDSAGNVYVADQANSTIRKMTPTGEVTTLAGSPGLSGSADGVGSAARFNVPGGVAVDRAGNVYVADIYNHRVTKGTPVDTTPPVITCPAPVLVSNDGQCHAVAVLFENPTATDNCDPNPTVSCDHHSGDLFPVGTTVVTCTATDAHGNSSTCSFTVTVSNDKSIDSDFNGTPIPGSSTVWFNAVIKASGLSSINGPVTVKIINQKITSSKFSLPVPDATVIFDPNATCAKTTCDGLGKWTTVAPKSGLAGNTFLSGLAYKVSAAGLPGGIKPVTWSGTFVTDTAGITLQWKWAAAVYNSSADLGSCSAIGVKATDDTKGDCTYKNSDAAGTPESVKFGVIGGARGGGGSNYTGSLSGTQTVAPCATF